MAKLPDIEYAVVTQGPPNPMQAFGSVAQGLDVLSDVTSRAQAAYAEELAKTQTSEASLIVESGLSQVESILKTKPYLSPNEVKQGLGENVPAEIQDILGKAQDPDQPSIETYRVGAAIHAAQAKRLKDEAGPVIYNPRVKAEFDRQLDARLARRNIDVQHSMMSQGAELNAAKTVALAEEYARNAITPGDWARVYSTIDGSGWLSPAQKEKYAAHFAGLQETQGKARTAAGLAEGALAAGRDGVSPWVDAGKAQAEFEKSVEGKDPLVVEDARKRFTDGLHRNVVARQMSDAPGVSALETEIHLGRGFSPLDPRFTALSPMGQERVAQTARATFRESRAAGLAANREQTAINKEAKDAFMALDPDKRVSFDPMTADLAEVLGDPRYAGVSRGGRLAIAGEWQKSKAAYAKGHGLNEGEFIRRASDLAEGLGWIPQGKKTDKAQNFEIAMRAEFVDWASHDENAGKRGPSKEEADAMFRRALEYGEQDIDPTSKMPAFLQRQKDMYAFEAKQKGVPFTTKGFETKQPAEKLFKTRGVGEPAGDGKVKVRRKSDGVVGRVTNPDPELYEAIP